MNCFNHRLEAIPHFPFWFLDVESSWKTVSFFNACLCKFPYSLLIYVTYMYISLRCPNIHVDSKFLTVCFSIFPATNRTICINFDCQTAICLANRWITKTAVEMSVNSPLSHLIDLHVLHFQQFPSGLNHTNSPAWNAQKLGVFPPISSDHSWFIWVIHWSSC